MRVIGDPLSGTTRQALKALRANTKLFTPAAFYGHGIQKSGVHRVKLTSCAPGLSMAGGVSTRRLVLGLQKAGVSIVSLFACKAGSAAYDLAGERRLMASPEVLVSLHGGKKRTYAEENLEGLFGLVDYYGSCLQEGKMPGNVERFVHQLICSQDQSLRVVVPPFQRGKEGRIIHLPSVRNTDYGAGAIPKRIQRLNVEQSAGNKNVFPNYERRLRKRLLKQEANAPRRDEQTSRAIDLRLRRSVLREPDLINRLHEIDKFLAMGANPKFMDGTGECLLFLALAQDHFVCKRLLDHPGVLPLTDTEIEAGLRFALRDDHPKLVKWLLQQPGIDVNRLGIGGEPVLCAAAAQDRSRIVGILLRTDAGRPTAWTPGKWRLSTTRSTPKRRRPCGACVSMTQRT